jgi:hypothetical protein
MDPPGRLSTTLQKQTEALRLPELNAMAGIPEFQMDLLE